MFDQNVITLRLKSYCSVSLILIRFTLGLYCFDEHPYLSQLNPLPILCWTCWRDIKNSKSLDEFNINFNQN